MVAGVLAIGQTLIILTAGIDLSCGMLMALGSTVMNIFAAEHGVNPCVAIACGVLVPTLLGFINGNLISFVRLPSFIVSLGNLNIAFANTQIYSEAKTVSGLPPPLLFLGNTFSLDGTVVTYGTVFMLLMYLIAWYVLRSTAAGRHVYALGNNAEATRRMGISTRLKNVHRHLHRWWSGARRSPAHGHAWKRRCRRVTAYGGKHRTSIKGACRQHRAVAASGVRSGS